ncbi:MAG TPA: CAP domain-containing protein [Polyangiaceae bacterium]|nr:CAP domain-containing protein [Polyangiaceae bacterium]
MLRLLRWWFWGTVICLGCSCGNIPVARGPAEHIDVPDDVAMYSTDATAAVGDARSEDLAREIAAELKKRGTPAVLDGALTATASWFLREANEARNPSASTMDAAARRFGFAGVINSTMAFALDDEHRETWRAALAQVPPNMPITRYGVSVSRSGRSAAVTFGAVEISLQPFQRHLSLSDKVELRGEVSARYSFAHVYLTKTDGSVEERRMPSRKIDASFSFSVPGVYQLEVMGDGATGPVIVCNVPLFVGVEETKVTGSIGSTTSPVEGEARMFALLNQSRKAAGLKPLQLDDELREIALAHSTDMVDHHFFGHVSPTTGTPDARLRQSAALVADFGENVSQASNAEMAHDGLMASPGHRANMLSARFTHVGIAAVSTETEQLTFTLIFGRRADPATMPRTTEQVEAAFLALRRKNGLSVPVSDPIYRVAVSAGIAAYVDASSPTLAVAVQAQDAALKREVQRTRSSRPATCALVSDLLELDQLEKTPLLLAPSLRRYGLAARIRTDSHGKRLAVMMLLEGAPCQ